MRRVSLAIALLISWVAPLGAAAADTLVVVEVKDENQRVISTGLVDAVSHSSVKTGSRISVPLHRMDTQGRASFRVPAPGLYEVRFWPIQEYREIRIDGTVETAPVFDLPPDRTEPIRITLVIPAVYIVRGLVIHPDGSPVRDVDLFAYKTDGSPVPVAQNHVRHDGSFELVTKSLPVQVIPRARGAAVSFEPSSRTVTDERVLVHFTEVESAQTIRGRVSEGKGGPIADMTVYSEPLCDGIALTTEEAVQEAPHAARSDSSGAFAVRCSQRCPFRIRVSILDTDYLQPEGVMVSAGACETELHFELERGGRLSGTIVDNDGRPVPELPLIIKIVEHDQEDSGEAGARHTVRASRTDHDGAFVAAGLEAGAYTVSIDDRGLKPEYRDLSIHGKPLLIERGEDRQKQFKALPGGRVCVGVTDDLGRFVSISEIALYDADNDVVVATRTVSESPHQEEAHALCTGAVAPGDYRVVVDGSSILKTWWPGVVDVALAQSVSIETEKTTDLDPFTVCRIDQDYPEGHLCTPSALATAQGAH